MITPKCPKCHHPIPGDDINVATDVAFCRPCNQAHKLSTIARDPGIDPNLDLSRPPAGVWQRSSGLGTVIGVSHRSWTGALATLAFAAFWNGIVSVFVAFALASTLALFGVERPSWFPHPIMNGSAMGVGITIVLWLFLTPFIAIGLAMIAAFFSCIAGRTEIRIRDNQGEIFSGVGPIGLKKRFNPALVKDVRIEDRRWTDSDGDRRRNVNILVELLEGKPLKLGSSLPDERRQFVAAALRQALVR